ncbi:hypothetical protein VVD49_06845 [Uliginosibacterium sp. H3]|uniref:Uncharacterized protein n=1 Tax=Uliginosibacterium silvisoli TaxID=3114758 RepID=A0ABU6K197_9RHOO|nr:hypothetical protein [Uliginosibacterium sp. H3]
MKKSTYWLLCLPIAVGFAYFGPSSGDGWHSACACVSAEAEFISFVAEKVPAYKSISDRGLESLDEGTVVAAFLAQIPLGSDFATIEERVSNLDRVCRESTNLYRCEYWLQANSTSQRGYSVAFHLSDDKHLTSIEARRIVRENASS